MDTQLQIQNKRLELIQWLSTIDDLNTLNKVSELISREQKHAWWQNLTDEERSSIEQGIADADQGKLNPHSKARELYGKWL